MRQSVLALTLLVSFLFPTNGFAEWVKVAKSFDGDTYYINSKVRKDDGHIYFWSLADYIKPIKVKSYEMLSGKVYHEADCKKFRWRKLQAAYHTQPMTRGAPYTSGSISDDPWIYPSPDTAGEAVLEAACEMAKNQ